MLFSLAKVIKMCTNALQIYSLISLEFLSAPSPEYPQDLYGGGQATLELKMIANSFNNWHVHQLYKMGGWL